MLRMKLGEFPEVTPEQAAKLAGKVSAQVTEGLDPREEKWKSRKELSLSELFDRYIEDYASVHKRSWRADVRQFNLYVGTLKQRALSSVTRLDLAALHLRVGKEHGRYSANRLLSLLSRLFTFAAELGFAGPNPTLHIKRFPEHSRERFLSADEMSRFLPAVDAEPAPWPDFFRLLLWTGVRRGNLAAARWEEIDLAAATWRIPPEKSKNKKAVTLPLTPEAVQILERRKAASAGSPWVFPALKPNPTGHVTYCRHAWKHICRRAGLVGVRVHDLRRTLGSWQAATGASMPVIGKSLGHSGMRSTAVYARLDLDPVRAAVGTAVAAMLAAASQEGGDA
jgi:integrase